MSQTQNSSRSNFAKSGDGGVNNSFKKIQAWEDRKVQLLRTKETVSYQEKTDEKYLYILC
jgi:hypothetical protein